MKIQVYCNYLESEREITSLLKLYYVGKQKFAVLKRVYQLKRTGFLAGGGYSQLANWQTFAVLGQ